MAGRDGVRPVVQVLDRLAEIYACDASDLLAGWDEHRATDDADPAAAAPPSDLATAALSWQVETLELPHLTRAVEDWSGALPEPERRSLLLKLSTAAAMAATAGHDDPEPAVLGRTPDPEELTGVWDSRYTYSSTGRDAICTGTHEVGLRAERGRLVGRSLPTSTGVVELDLTVSGLLVTGSWSDRTAADGYYGGAVYRGTLQLVLDPTGRSMTGKWLGPDKSFAVDSGDWRLARRSGTAPP